MINESRAKVTSTLGTGREPRLPAHGTNPASAIMAGHTLSDERDYAHHIDYIHFNPVKHGHVDGCGTGPIRRFTGSCGLGFIRLTGRIAPKTLEVLSVNHHDGYRCAQPILRLLDSDFRAVERARDPASPRVARRNNGEPGPFLTFLKAAA